MRARAAGGWVGVSTLVTVLAHLTWVQAQAPTAVIPGGAASLTSLPVRRIVLYKSGVGYFEHVGRISGSQTVNIDFTSGQLDDVLSSLTALDLDGGRILGVSYNSDDALARRLGALRLPVGEAATRATLLAALRGARVDIRASSAHVVGRLLGMSHETHEIGGGAIERDVASVVTDDGAIRDVALDPNASVRLLDADLKQDVSQYLSLVGAARDEDRRRLSIATRGTGFRDLRVSYVSEVPVWKATYRIVLPASGDDRKPLLQGWAIVDNTGAQDWADVQLSLVAGAPQSFIQEISRPDHIQRPVVPVATMATMRPQTHQGAIASGGTGVISGVVTDYTGAVMPGVTIQVAKGSATAAQIVSTSSGRFRTGDLPVGTYSVTAALSGFKREVLTNVVVTGGMESVVNFKLRIGQAAETLTVVAESPLVDTKKTAGGNFTADQNVKTPTSRAAWNLEGGNYDSFQEMQVAAEAKAMGDLFEYQVRDPVTIRRNQSALIPILSSPVEAERVSLWNARANGGRPLRGVWLTNASGLTLDAGSFSVIDGRAFAGEGLMDPMKPGERRLLSYATDLGVQVVSQSDGVPTVLRRIEIAHGLVIEHSEAHQRQTYVVRNDEPETRTVVIEHPVHPGWTLDNGLTPDERTAQWLRFKLPVAAKTTVNFAVDEVQPVESQDPVDAMTDDQIVVLVTDRLITPETEAQLRRIQAQKAEVARLASEQAVREASIAVIGTDQQRVRENMQALRGTAEERQLLQRYVKQLDAQETQLAALRKEAADLAEAHRKAQADLGALIAGLTVG